jgi:Cu(I)/Ag(I) efflux system periplasmic protein CusF
MKMRNPMLMLLLSAATLPFAAHAANADHEAHHAAPAGDAAAAQLSSGEVRKVDPATKKITIRHGPLENLGMPPMTMVFQVSDPALLADVKAGDKVRFTAENRGGALVLTRLERE